MKSAPICVFCYNRPQHLSRCLEALAENPPAGQSPLFIFCDGAKSEADAQAVAETRQVARDATGFGEIQVRESSQNAGLSRSISAGVSELCERFGKAIVVEDDLVVSPQFLGYMNQALDRFENEDAVMQVSGYMFPIDFGQPTRSFFLPLTTSWGWATWQRAWRHFSNDPSQVDLSAFDEETERRFNLDGAYPYSGMLRGRISGKNDSWAILWWWLVFNRNGIVLHPSRSLVSNIGFDGSGTHFTKKSSLASSQSEAPFTGGMALPTQVELDKAAMALLKEHLFSSRQKKPKTACVPKPEPPRKEAGLLKRLLQAARSGRAK